MKNAVSNVWLLGLVILFIMSFTGFLAVTVSYSRAFKIKDMALTKIENYGGVTDKAPACSGSTCSGPTSDNTKGPGTLQSINAFLVGSGYKVVGKCASSDTKVHWYGIRSLAFGTAVGSSNIVHRPTDKKNYYCISKYPSNLVSTGSNVKAYYYNVKFFFQLELPVLGDIFTFEIDGQTNDIVNGVPVADDVITEVSKI